MMSSALLRDTRLVNIIQRSLENCRIAPKPFHAAPVHQQVDGEASLSSAMDWRVGMDPLDDNLDEALAAAHEHAKAFLSSIRSMRAGTPPVAPVPLSPGDEGRGAKAAIEEMLGRFGSGFSGTAGPRYWAFVNGGTTPAALAGDWLCSSFDQNCQRNGDSIATVIEFEAIAMLQRLFGLPAHFNGMFVTGGTMANYTALATAVQTLGRNKGVDVSREGIAALGPIHILSGEAHSSIAKSASMMGVGRNVLIDVPRLPDREAVDIEAMDRVLAKLPPEHSKIIVGNAGTVLTGDFDDLDGLADLAARHRAHLHVDGAFGAFAACLPSHRHLVKGLDRADSVASDGHKFLNVPFDSGFVFTRQLPAQVDVFQNVSAYQALPDLDPQHYIHLSPQNSRRLRALPAWLTLRAYGIEGYRRIVERCARLALSIAAKIDSEPGFRLLRAPRFNVVCFQLHDGKPADRMENEAFLKRIIDDGRVVVSRGELDNEPCVRFALVNWMTTEQDIEIAMEAFRARRFS
jgi:glutamate/tyrosine decarboxylase-like PLP-dependent enzyme